MAMHYELKPQNVSAVLFKGHNWNEVEALLGPHRVKTEQEMIPPHDTLHFVYDVKTKQWLNVFANSYVVVDKDSAVEVWNKVEFEDIYQPVPIKNPWPHTINTGPNLPPGWNVR